MHYAISDRRHSENVFLEHRGKFYTGYHILVDILRYLLNYIKQVLADIFTDILRYLLDIIYWWISYIGGYITIYYDIY